jgi:hypothetical protein
MAPLSDPGFTPSDQVIAPVPPLWPMQAANAGKHKEDRDLLETRSGAPLDFRNDQMAQVGVGAAKIKVEFDFTMTSPFLSQRTDFLLEGPGVGGLLVKLPIDLTTEAGFMSRPGARLLSASSPSWSRIRPRTQAVSTPASIMR